MRTFGEVKEYFEFQLEGSEKIYQIPLAASLPASIMINMKNADKRDEGFEAQYEMLRKYMGDDVEELSSSMATNILEAWAEESNENGASPGES